MKKYGTLAQQGLVIQPDRTIVGKNDGTLTGDVRFKVDSANEGLLPGINSQHPDDKRLLLHTHKITKKTGKASLIDCSYFGLASDPTDKILQHPGSAGRDPIETHENFTSFAGSPDDPKNGARFDEQSGQFLGFFDPEEDELFGVRSYYVPDTSVYLSYWTYSVPRLTKLFSTKSSIPGVKKPPNVKNFLLIGLPYRQVGGASIYQVTEQWLGSGPKGWSKKIYK